MLPATNTESDESDEADMSLLSKEELAEINSQADETVSEWADELKREMKNSPDDTAAVTASEVEDSKKNAGISDETLAVAVALEFELAALHDQLAAGDTSALTENTSDFLTTILAGTVTAYALRSAMTAAFARGALDAGGSHIRLMPGLMHPERTLTVLKHSGVLSGATMATAAADIARRADVTAKVLKAQLIQDQRDLLNEGKETPQEIAAQLTRLESNFHVQKHADISSEQANGFGEYQARPRTSYTEFYREENRIEWRDWPTKWRELGGTFHGAPSDYPEGRMIHETDSRFWEELSAFGTPWAPFDYNSGMNIKPVDAEEAERLGLGKVRPVGPRAPKLEFNAKIEFSADYDDDVKSALLDSMQDWVDKKPVAV